MEEASKEGCIQVSKPGGATLHPAREAGVLGGTGSGQLAL